MDRRGNKTLYCVFKLVVRFSVKQKLYGLIDIKRENADKRVRVNGVLTASYHHVDMREVRKRFKNLDQAVFIDC